MQYDIIIMGAGPAGLTAAAAGVTLGRRVLVLDKATHPGTKLLLTGGGKGNVTNRRVEHTDYFGENPTFARNALTRKSPDDVRAEFENAGIPLEEREHGRLFCTTSTRAVLDMLLAKLPRNLCRIETLSAVTSLSFIDSLFTARCGDMAFTAPRLVIATGSPAWPQCGADDSGMRLARGFGHRIVPPKPVLAPLIMPPSWPLAGLAGISAKVHITCDAPGSPAFEDSLLFTHKGLSGPAVLQISCYWHKGSKVIINFIPGKNAEEVLDSATGKATPQSAFSRFLPERLITALLDPILAKRRVAELSRKSRSDIASAIQAHTVTPLRTEGLMKAEAASGGIDTREVNPQNLESSIIPGLFFCGEVLDVTGRLGGYNLHWAWASGLVAGESAARV